MPKGLLLGALSLHLLFSYGDTISSGYEVSGGSTLQEVVLEGLAVLVFIVAGIGLLFYLHNRELL